MRRDCGIIAATDQNVRGEIEMVRWVALALAVVLALPAAAQAGWYKAESPHFVVYANDSERDVTKFAQMLERFHSAMRLLTARDDVVPSPSNRVVIFAVGGESRIRQLVGGKNSNVAGFYIPRAGGSRAFVPNIAVASGENDFSMTVLLHEYAHHMLLSTRRFAMPRWVDEGAAEFFSSVKFERDGSVGIGRPAYHRATELAYAADVKVEELLDHELYAKQHGRGFDAFYGRAWALYHYLFFEPQRKGQLNTYFRAIATGKSERDAAGAAFGDLKQLEKELDAYQRRSKVSYYKLPPDMLTAATVTTTPLSAGESAVIPLRIRSQRGVNREQALELVGEVRAVAAKFPQDGAVFAALAEAEYDSGNDAAAIAAADTAIALDPRQVNAYVQKGYALFRIAADTSAEARAPAFASAMKPFQALNRIENDHPLPLIYFYRSYTEQHREPTELARHALERASQLAPFDRGLAFETALMQAAEGKIAIATANLKVIAADPHGGSMAAQAQTFADDIGKLAEGTPWSGPSDAPDVELSEDDGGDS